MDKYREIVKKYYLDIKNRNLKEEPRREKFLSLLKDLFTNSIDEIQKYTDGAEKSVKIQGSGKEFIKNSNNSPAIKYTLFGTSINKTKIAGAI